MRGPGSPFDRLLRSRRRLDGLIHGEIDERRASGERGQDILSMLLDARDEDGRPLDREEIRDEVMTLLFAGHDTTTSTVAFLFYELARNPEWLDDPRVSVEMLIDETLRKYPPAYTGPRRALETFELCGRTIPAGAHVHYSSWASHNLPDVFEQPERFDPLRFTDEARAALPKGAYVPFGGGSRTCIGMRFGQAEIATIARSVLSRFRLELVPGYRLRIRHAPTISPRGGLRDDGPRRAAGPRTAARAGGCCGVGPQRFLRRADLDVQRRRAVAGALEVAEPLRDEQVRALGEPPARREVAVRGDLDGLRAPVAGRRRAGS